MARRRSPPQPTDRSIDAPLARYLRGEIGVEQLIDEQTPRSLGERRPQSVSTQEIAAAVERIASGDADSAQVARELLGLSPDEEAPRPTLRVTVLPGQESVQVMLVDPDLPSGKSIQATTVSTRESVRALLILADAMRSGIRQGCAPDQCGLVPAARFLITPPPAHGMSKSLRGRVAQQIKRLRDALRRECPDLVPPRARDGCFRLPQRLAEAGFEIEVVFLSAAQQPATQ